MPVPKHAVTDTLIAELLQNANRPEIGTQEVGRYRLLARTADRFRKAQQGMRT